MAIDPTSMTSLLEKIESARAAMARLPIGTGSTTAGPGTGGVAGAGGGKQVDFAAVLRNQLTRVDQVQNDAMGLAERFQQGDPKVTLEETMVSLSKANISFQQMVQVRNRVIAAYHDIMNLQV
jgi:flagellar hook-basal body complex protein FliE